MWFEAVQTNLQQSIIIVIFLAKTFGLVKKTLFPQKTQPD